MSCFSLTIGMPVPGVTFPNLSLLTSYMTSIISARSPAYWSVTFPLPLGNELNYPTGDPALSSQINVWEPGFNSPWHYHPYTGVAYVIQGELTVNYDTETSINDTMSEKNIITTQTYKAGEEAFLGVRDTWHLSQNLGDEDLIFLVTWIGEKGSPLAILEK